MSNNNFIKSLTMSQTAMALTVGLGMKKDNMSVDELIEQCRAALPKQIPPVKPKRKSNLCPSCGKGILRPVQSKKGEPNIVGCKLCRYSTIK